MADETPEASDIGAGTLASGEGEGGEAQGLAPNGGSPSVGAKEDEEEEEENEEEKEEGPEEDMTLADELFEKGSKAIEDGDLFEAVDCLSRALEIRVKHFGELAQECATSYYKYGCALLYKAQEEADPLGSIPRNIPPNSEVRSSSGMEEGGKSKASICDSNDTLSLKSEEVGEGHVSEEGSSGKYRGDKSAGGDNGNDGSEGDDDELTEGDENESDLDLAWKMLDIARAILEKHPGDTIEKVNVFAALAETSLERDDIDTSLNDYLKALSIVEGLLEPDHRRVVELNFRICLVLELGSKIEEAIPYCEKAISLCKSRLERLTVNATNISRPTGDAESCTSDSQASGNQSAGEASSGSSKLVEEIDLISGILTELEKKLEDLQQVKENPGSVMSEMASKQTSEEKNPPRSMSRDLSMNSSQMGTIVGFDSPTISSATNGGVTHLGVVGRGTKRATIKTSSAEPSPKRAMLDPSMERSDSSITTQETQGLDHSPADAKTD